MKHTIKSFRHMLCTTCGLCLALSVLTSLFIVTVTNRVGSEKKILNNDKNKLIYQHSDSAVTEITVNQQTVKQQNDKKVSDYNKLQKAYKVCKEIVDTETNETEKTTVTTDNQSTTSTTATIDDEHTTVTTTVSSQAIPTTVANSEPDVQETESVSNGMQPFNYNDVSSIAYDLSTLGDFVDHLLPEQISWDSSEFNSNGCVKITLDSEHGSTVLYVKPSGDIPSDTEESGSVSGDEIEDWQWLTENRSSGCNISSVTWLDSEFGIEPVREIGIGSTLAQLTDKYLCVNGGATTLYRASDVISEQNKLNSILAAENLYTFVGGKVYSIGSYLDKYYNGKEHTFIFEDCDYVVQYGCNSIMEHNYTTGSWIIEYAVKEDSVIGISFMNKSYYKTEQKTAVSTNIPSSGSESEAVTTAPSITSDASDASDTSDAFEEESEDLTDEDVSLDENDESSDEYDDNDDDVVIDSE